MLAQPRMAKLLGVGVQGIFGKGVLSARLAKDAFRAGASGGSVLRMLKGFGLPHQPHPLPRFSQAGVVDLAGRLQPSAQSPFLGTGRPQRHLAYEGGRALGWVGSRTSLGSHGHLVVWMRNICSYPEYTTGRLRRQSVTRKPFIPRLKIGG